VGCLEDIYVLLNVSRSTTIRPFFHNQHDELRLLIHFLKHPFILHDLNNLQLLLDFNNLIFSSKEEKRYLLCFFFEFFLFI
ncbi:unnamed protein product, partial [Rotaria sp. Silwood2]